VEVNDAGKADSESASLHRKGSYGWEPILYDNK